MSIKTADALNIEAVEALTFDAIDALNEAKHRAEGLRDLLSAMAESPSYGSDEYLILGEAAGRVSDLISSALR